MISGLCALLELKNELFRRERTHIVVYASLMSTTEVQATGDAKEAELKFLRKNIFIYRFLWLVLLALSALNRI